ncbi:dolichyl-phosphate-mannose-protein mannosyltransferase [Pseudonocardia hierapolitana]|uniref:Dolichyl-phosphate-mannose-protein mannosyltransferase n=1 Tax=Pseudonocardia hierapolitana TaxID=1128676 RepID=A0A561SID9_9PSEU|nr:glycosyltransferase family 39 protein [Pseudonocardia hierapolitana]TWF74641.1 dolichyl-phosphate-mannose-protein mannosyltransferase [Pseudonocardia hierapolitana]
MIAVAEVPPRARAAWGGLGALAAGVAALLLAVSGRYGYHRDELYFLRAGREPAFGYVDQPPLTPFLARAMDTVLPGSLTGLRLPSVLAAALVVVLTGLIARELGGGRGAQLLAAASMGVSAVLLVVGHLLSTTTFDLLAWTALTWLLVRALRDGGAVWLATGAVAGLAVQNKSLPLVLLAGVLVGVLAVGPRAALASRWPWLGAAVALVIWAPNLAWQAANGFPVFTLSTAIAGGSSGSSEPWYLFLPFQLVLVSPLLVPVWALGWWRLARDPALRTWRAFAVAYVLVAVLFLVTGGKPYYLAGFFPVLLAAGAPAVVEWARRGARRIRSGLIVAALALSLAMSALLMLPLVPVGELARTPVPDINYDAGETVGWPEFAATIAAVHAQVPAGERVAVLTGNYGEAGAVDRFLPALTPAHSGHNSYWSWGPPPEEAATLIVVGLDETQLRRWFGAVELAARVDNGVGLDNDEQGEPVWLVRERRVPWSQLWPQLRHIG